MTIQRTQELQRVKLEPKTKTYNVPVEQPPMKRQCKKNEGKQLVSYPSRPKTRPTNKFRLKSKSLFKPSLKEDNLIILEDDSPKQNLEKRRLVSRSVKRKQTRTTKKGKKKQSLPNIESSQSYEGKQQDPTYNP